MKDMHVGYNTSEKRQFMPIKWLAKSLLLMGTGFGKPCSATWFMTSSQEPHLRIAHGNHSDHCKMQSRLGKTAPYAHRWSYFYIQMSCSTQLVIYSQQKFHRHNHNVLKSQYEGIIHKQPSRSIGDHRAELRGNTLQVIVSARLQQI
jgi:hypothetical protein